MAFSTVNQLKLDALNSIAKSLIRLGTSKSQLQTVMAEDITSFEKETGYKLSFRSDNADGHWFSVAISKKKDVASTKKPNEVRMINARINDVVISANFYKPGVYDHSNAHVAQALRALADMIEKAPVRLADHDYTLM